MSRTGLLLNVSVFVAAAAITGWVRHFALAHAVLDVPNARSSHTEATPRGGGAAVVLVVSVAALILFAQDRVSLPLLAALLGGLLVALVGFLDDRRRMSAGLRLAAHFAAAIWAVLWLGGLAPLQIGAQLFHSGPLGYLLAVLGIVWTLNLFNFMDGIDGIAASEAVFVAAAGALLSASAQSGVSALAWVLASASAGFLLMNWPPARIFMGDIGSGYLGYVIAVLALAATADSPVGAWLWLILGAVFFADATLTLVRRLARGEPAHEAHRSHAYQLLARRWGSHRRVTLAVGLVNMLWLAPCALWAQRQPAHAAAIVLLAIVPLALIAAACGAGRPEVGAAN